MKSRGKWVNLPRGCCEESVGDTTDAGIAPPKNDEGFVIGFYLGRWSSEEIIRGERK
jgi:hypothetical protein